MNAGRTVETGIWKSPVDGPLAVGSDQLEGDGQADLRVHGGRDKAVYAYAMEDLDWWAATYDRPFPPGLLGENLTTEGIDVTGAIVGERWQVGCLSTGTHEQSHHNCKTTPGKAQGGIHHWAAMIEELGRSAHIDDVMESTGPFALTRCYERWDDKTGLSVKPAEVIYPVSEPE